jgi:RimJ/RimL family protein N-acetyltransferase
MLSFRFAQKEDVDLYYKWANDPATRRNSYNQSSIEYGSHVKWFYRKISSVDCFMYVFLLDNMAIGQVRIEKLADAPDDNKCMISISIDEAYRGKGYSTEMIMVASGDYLERNEGFQIIAHVFTSNQPSYKSFLKAGYVLQCTQEIQGIPSYVLLKTSEHA